jgi:hypothetical protein
MPARSLRWARPLFLSAMDYAVLAAAIARVVTCSGSAIVLGPESAPVQVSRTPASRDYRGAPTTGVREAPRHEIAGRKGLGFADAVYGDLRRARVCFREVGTTNALQFDELSGRGERALPALGSGSALRRRLQDVGAASASKRRRRWLTVGGENGKNGRRCVVVDNVILIMTYRS